MGDKDKDDVRCSFFVYRKKRSCRMMVKPGKRFCGEHAHLDPDLEKLQADTEITGRVPCPNDPKHSCEAKKLDKHLLKCPSKPEPQPEYVQTGVNGSIESDPALNLSIRNTPDEKLMAIISRIDTLFENEIRDNVKDEISSHSLLLQEMADNSSYYGPEVLKHLVQNSSLLGHLENSGQLSDNQTFVEFGSGRGQLTYWVVKSTKSAKNCRYFLIDRDSHRHKFDNRLKDQDPEADVERIRADIQNLLLAKVPGVEKDSNKVVSLSKHLCGVATDFALNCIHNFSADVNQSERVGAILIALCCHHRCLWSSYVGKEYLLEHGFTVEEFSLLCGLTSWATCGSGKPRSQMNPVEEPDSNKDDAKVLSRYEVLGLDRLKREEIGRRAKRILDYGRVHFVKTKIGLGNCRLLYYVDTSISLENVAIFASRTSELQIEKPSRLLN